MLGAPGAPLAEAAAQAAARDGQPLMQAPADAGAEGLRAAMTLAWLRGAALYLPYAHWAALLPADDHAHAVQPLPALPALPALPLSLFVGIHERAAIRALGEQVLPAVEVPPPSFAERLAAWQQALPSAARRPVLAELARRFRGQTTAIERIAAELARLGREPTAEELLAAARADLDLGALGERLVLRVLVHQLDLGVRGRGLLQVLVHLHPPGLTEVALAHPDDEGVFGGAGVLLSGARMAAEEREGEQEEERGAAHGQALFRWKMTARVMITPVSMRRVSVLKALMLKIFRT